MSSTMHAPQQAMSAAAARACSAFARGTSWNGSVAVAVGSYTELTDIAAKRPARHLGGRPT